jgi:hypothetical protein
MGVDCFFSPIFSYFCLFVAALRPCQGKLPRRKYIKTWPRDSRSSRLDCSVDGSEVGITPRRANRRTSSQVSVDTHVSCSATKTLAFTVRYMLLCLWVTILLGHPKIHDVNDWLPSQRFNAQPTTQGRDIKEGGKERHAPFAAFVPGRPTRKLSGLISR